MSNYKQTRTEKKLAHLAKEHLEAEGITLNDVRESKAETEIPIGGLNLRNLIKGCKPLSIKLQIKLIEFFGGGWELKAIFPKHNL